jgi:murein DD-endopeptidase MepM/ murein hydrolase activator NlpD
MRRKLVVLAAAATLCGTTSAATLAAQIPADGADSALSCTGPTDSAALDQMLASAGSPLAGLGATFVAAGVANGIDPRLLVAIAAQETMLETYGPAQTIHNPFGLGPGIDYPTDAAAIHAAATNLAQNYVADGLATIPQIANKWAPPGASNDPSGLNLSWPANVSHFFSVLGGNPGAPVVLTAQPASCTTDTAASMIAVKPLGGVQGTFIQGPAQPGGTHAPAFNIANGSGNWQSIWAVDLGVPVGTPVYATFSGRIVTVHSGESGRFAGIGVGLDSDHGLAAYYAHLSSVTVSPGQNVTAGQIIGATGEANGVAHLHFALGRSYADASPSNGLDPRPFIAHAAVSAAAAAAALAAQQQLPAGSGTPVVTVWGGNTPLTVGPGPEGGNAPGAATAATISPFAFPVALRPGGQARYSPPTCTPGALCTVDIATPPNADIVAATPGTLEGASPAERSNGIAFWIVTASGTRIGYGPLATYLPGIVAGATVTLGEPLGAAGSSVAIAWTKGGVSVNPWPLLTAVRPSN